MKRCVPALVLLGLLFGAGACSPFADIDGIEFQARPADLGPSDQGRPPLDQGGPLVDQGPVPGDQGPALVDQGPLPDDQGTPQVDQGPALDQGDPVKDQGPLPADEGPPPVDEGTPPADEGTPPADEGTPPTDEGTPVTDEGAPLTDQGGPALDQGGPDLGPAVCQIDGDGDGFGPGCPAGDDCDDTDPDVHPGAAERCNGEDDDCDGHAEEGLVAPDDEHCLSLGVCAEVLPHCEGQAGWVCTYPAQYEAEESTCDGLDNDCDGATDEGCCGPCPAHPLGWAASCNEQDACEYAPAPGVAPAEIWIPAGSFAMGAPEGEPGSGNDERPVHAVTFERGFWIDKYLVTTREYEACEAAQACSSLDDVDLNWDAGGWGVNRSAAGRAEHPQNALTFGEAGAVCAHRGGRLPSEAEWERAAVGSAHRLYPWGDFPAPTCVRAVFREDAQGAGTEGYGCDEGGTWPVGSKPLGASAYGLLDTVGNLLVWVADCVHNDYTEAPVDGSAWLDECSGNLRMVRSAAYYASSPDDLRSAERTSRDGTRHAAYMGVRCVRPAP